MSVMTTSYGRFSRFRSSASLVENDTVYAIDFPSFAEQLLLESSSRRVCHLPTKNRCAHKYADIPAAARRAQAGPGLRGGELGRLYPPQFFADSRLHLHEILISQTAEGRYFVCNLNTAPAKTGIKYQAAASSQRVGPSQWAPAGGLGRGWLAAHPRERSR